MINSVKTLGNEMTAYTIDRKNFPGLHIRRLQQIAVAIFTEETAGFDVTPVQYASLAAIQRSPNIDQRTLARTIGIDPATIGSVIQRLETRGLVRRADSPQDGRVRLLSISPKAVRLLQAMDVSTLRTQHRILEPLPPEKRAIFMEMLRTLTEGNNDVGRVPSMKPAPDQAD